MEELLHRSRPSQILSLHVWIVAILAACLIAWAWPLGRDLVWDLVRWRVPNAWLQYVWPVPLIAGFWRSLVIFTTVYKVTDQRVMRRVGVFSVAWEEIEMSRILDFSVTQPFLLRIFGLGNLAILSSDRTTPELRMLAQRRVGELRNSIRELVLDRQKKLGHREIYSSHS